ncbi:hypothetical protein BOTBODRAFT_145308 [Botryobasidium botryosum FD-172 SS1]|uniref:SET domain-containing protein n=1 Tax=Botryobasidium botryosum (strain FD-172 SS1) TaxID=930990 RepID=A0A067MTU6_BOTB1|nr:hypothetical protein BOTBODRAFT_145308 [Botryobasidium botryosum FD-172 SS1]
MQAHHIHKGQYLLCRIASGPAQEDGVVYFAVEDPAGVAAITFKIHKYPGATLASTAALDVLFPLGTLLAIREPKLVLGPSPTPRRAISVYSPADLVFVQPLDPILGAVTWQIPAPPPVSRLATEWKEIGNQHFQDGRYFVAAVAYSRDLAVDPDAYVLQINRAAAYLHLECYSAAVADAATASLFDKISDRLRMKALYRTAQAQYGLTDYEEALRNFAQCLFLTPEDVEIKGWTERCRGRIHERDTGEYDWSRMFRKAQVPGNTVDAEEFVGPIKIGESARSGGKGIFATKNIKAGDLLLVSKPVVVSFPQEFEGVDYELGANLITLKTDSVCRQSLIAKLITKLVGDPGLYLSISALYAGPSYPAPPLQLPPPVYAREPPFPAVPDLLRIETSIDVGLIERVIAYNAFNLNDVTRPPCFACTRDLYKLSSALYLLPSLLNHACSANSTWCNFGDLLVVRATKDVAEGGELTIPYIPLEGPWESLSRTYLDRELKHHMNRCDCDECEADRLDGEEACARREGYLAWLRETQEWTVRRARGLVWDMEATYSADRKRGRWASARARLILAEAIIRKERRNSARLEEAIQEAMKALEENGIVVLDKSAGLGPRAPENSEGDALPIAIGSTPIWSDVGTCVRAMLKISSLFHSHGDSRMMERWAKAACWFDTIYVGKGRDIFMARHDGLIRSSCMDLLGPLSSV